MADRAVVCDADENRIAGNIFGPTVYMSARMIDVPPVLDSNQVGDLCDVIKTTVEARERAGLWKPVDLADLFHLHRLEACVNVVFKPGHAVSRIFPLIDRDALVLEIFREPFDYHTNGLEPGR